jgi:hypothetical protein
VKVGFKNYNKKYQTYLEIVIQCRRDSKEHKKLSKEISTIEDSKRTTLFILDSKETSKLLTNMKR